MIKDIHTMTVEELKSQYLKERKIMFEKMQTLENKIESLEKTIADDSVNIEELKLQLRISEEQRKQLIAAKYQSQRNTVIVDMPTLFDDCENEVLKIEELENEEAITVNGHKRKKAVKEKHTDYSHLEHVIETVETPEGEDICTECGTKMTIKKYEEKKELVYEPAKIYVRVRRIPVLECVECQSINEEGNSTYHMIAHRKPVFPRSMASPELLAYIIDMKYNNGLPLYTIEKMFERTGVIISRQNMANWMIGTMQYFQPLFEIMKEELFKGVSIHCDETRTQVLNEEGKLSTSTSYMFVYCNNKYDTSIVLYDYRPSRSGDGPKEFLKGYHGYITTDAYDGYNKVDDVIRTFCNVHALRKFKDAYKLLPNTKARVQSDEAIAIRKYDEIFSVEHKIQEAAANKKENKMEYIQKCREKKIKPIFDKFLTWLEDIQDCNKGRDAMSKAIFYTLNNKTELMRFIDNGYIALDNSNCERNIRPFVVIRNRCKFYVSPNGAESSAILYSLVITCMQNRVNPYMYFTYILERLPSIDITDKEELRKLLPYSDSLPEYTKILSKREIKKILEQDN